MFRFSSQNLPGASQEAPQINKTTLISLAFCPGVRTSERDFGARNHLLPPRALGGSWRVLGSFLGGTSDEPDIISCHRGEWTSRWLEGRSQLPPLAIEENGPPDGYRGAPSLRPQGTQKTSQEPHQEIRPDHREFEAEMIDFATRIQVFPMVRAILPAAHCSMILKALEGRRVILAQKRN